MDEKDKKDVNEEVAKEQKEVAEAKKEAAQEKKDAAEAKKEAEDAKKEVSEEKQELEAKEAIEAEMQEEIRNFAESSPEMGPNSFWGSSGTWWVLGIAGILIIFLVIWVCFFYGPN